MITELVSPSSPKAKFKYSPFVKAGPFIQSAGLVGPGPETGQILRNLKTAMNDFGLRLDDMVIAHIYTTSMARFPEINQEWDGFFTGQSILPARTAVGVSALPINASVEIEFQFFID